MTAQWIPPRTWATGELVTELILNQHVRDNLEWLKDRTAGTDDLAGGDITTTSTSFTDATGLSITLTTNGGRVELGFSGLVSNSNANQAVNMTFLVNSVDVGHATHGLGQFISVGATQRGGICLSYLSAALSSGTYIFKVRWKVSANTGTLYEGAHFWARES